MKKKPRKTKLPRCLEKIVRAPASLPPEFINEIMTEIVRAHGKITAEMKEEVDRIVKRQQEKHVRQMMALKLKALLWHYGIPEDAPGAGWRLAGELAEQFVPGFARTDTPPRPPYGSWSLRPASSANY
jgi:hypothetical protein